MTAKTDTRPVEPPADRDARIGREADRWLVLHAQGPLAPDDARAFNQWLSADPEHEAHYRAGQAALRQVPLMRGLDEIEALMKPSPYERVYGAFRGLARWLASVVRRPAIRWAVLGTAAAGAAVAVAVVSVRPPLLSPDRVAPAHHATAVAQIRDVALADGSVVTLGAASAMTVAFSAAERRVTLSAGEAFFDVRADAARPFVVAAGNTLVRVLGTKFDVSLGSEVIDVAVSEGRVEVIRPEGDVRVIDERDIKHVLVAGQRVSAPKAGRVRPVQTIAIENVAAWRRGELVWVDTPVRDIVADLNRYSERTIVLGDAATGAIDLTLAFQVADVDGAATLLAATLGVDAIERADGTLVLR